MEKIFINCIIYEGLMSSIYKEVKLNNKTTQNKNEQRIKIDISTKVWKWPISI